MVLIVGKDIQEVGVMNTQGLVEDIPVRHKVSPDMALTTSQHIRVQDYAWSTSGKNLQ